MIDVNNEIVNNSEAITFVQPALVPVRGIIWRRLLAEFIGTFMLILVAAGSGVVGTRYPGAVPLESAAAAASLIVLVLVLSLGRISGCHLNAVITIAFALRNVFPWRRVPGYLLAQLLGAIAAALLLRTYFGDVANVGTLGPSAGVNDGGILIWEAILTFGLITTILAVVNGGMNVGHVAAFAIAAYFGAAILWAGPIEGASMNPTRQLGPALVSGDFTHLWAYMIGPFIGMLLAVGVAYLLRGPGGRDTQGPEFAQGNVEAVLQATKVVINVDASPRNETKGAHS
jgi:aquaporin Z